MRRSLTWKFRTVVVILLTTLLVPAAFAVTTLKTITVGKKPGPIVANPSSHLIYVVNQMANSVSVIDSELLTVKKTLAVGSMPVAIAVNPAANMVYVANAGAGTISAITGTQAAVTWTVGGKPIALVVDTVLNKLFVADSMTRQVKILDATTGAGLATLPSALVPKAMALNIATHALFVACSGSTGSVVVIDGTLNSIITTVTTSIPAGISSTSVDPSSDIVVAVSPTAQPSSAVAVIDAGNGYSVQVVPGDTGAKPTATAFDPGGIFLIADNGDGNIFFADGSGVVTLGDAYDTQESGASILAASAATNQMGVLYPAGDFIFIIDMENPLFLQNYHLVTTGNAPSGIVFDPLTSRAFVSNATDNTVSVIDVSPRTMVPAYDGSTSNSEINVVDSNPATGTIYSLHLGNVYAVNEVQAEQGSNGQGQNTAGVTKISLASTNNMGAIVVNAATNKIYAGVDIGKFYSINGATNVAKALTILPPTSNIEALTLNSAANQILAWDSISDTVFVIDSAKDTLLKTIPLNSASSSGVIAADPVTNLGYVSTTNIIHVIDPNAGSIVTSVPLNGAALGIAVNPAANRVYVITNARHVYAIDTTTNSIAGDITLTPLTPLAVAVNPVTGNFYVLSNDGNGVWHVSIYIGSTNTLSADVNSNDNPVLSFASNFAVNPLTNTIYVGKSNFQGQTGIASIDGQTNAVSALPPDTFDDASYALTLDLGTSTLAGAGYSYTTLWTATTDLSGNVKVPIAVTLTGIADAQTITTKPLFRTHNTRPSFRITATSNFSENAAALTPKLAFYQVDGWQGPWKPLTLTVQSDGITSRGTAKLPVLTTGQHILYAFAAGGDNGTVQDANTGSNSPAMSPVAAVVFTVEK